MPKSICVFAGSSSGAQSQYRQAARELGRELAARNCGLVYGGASVGLMAVVADTVLEAGGNVTGVIPEFLVKKEMVHAGLSDLRIVRSMQERKALMAELANGFVAHRSSILVAADARTLLSGFEKYRAPSVFEMDKGGNHLNAGSTVFVSYVWSFEEQTLENQSMLGSNGSLDWTDLGGLQGARLLHDCYGSRE